MNFVEMLALAALGIAGTTLVLLLMNSLIHHTSAVAASSVIYLITITQSDGVRSTVKK